MASLFDRLPARLFAPLAAQGAPVYAEVLLALFREVQRQPLPLSRDLALQIVSEILEAPNAFEETAELEPDRERAASRESRQDLDSDCDALAATPTDADGVASDADGVATDAPGVATDAPGGPEPLADEDPVRARARRVLAYLVECGWLKVENQRDLSQDYILLTHAFQLLRVLDEICSGDTYSPEGLICTIHDLLHQAAEGGLAHVRLMEAYRLTELYINVLKELQHNIGQFYEGLAERERPAEVLEHLFVDYRQGVVERTYHKIRTTEHASRFRPGIVEALARLRQPERLAEAASDLRKSGGAGSVDEGQLKLQEAIGTIHERMDALDGLLSAVDDRNRQFHDAAIRKVELTMNAGSSTSGQLHQILVAFTSGQADPADYPTLVDRFSLELMGPGSLATPAREARAFAPAPPERHEPDPVAIEEARERSTRQIRLALRFSRQKVQEYALRALGNRPAMRASELPLTGPDDLPMLIYLRRYGDGSLGYRVDRKTRGAWIVMDGVGFEDFTIERVQARPARGRKA